MAKILIVDDHEAQRVFLREILTDAGYDLIFAGDGAVAFERYKDHEPEVVITDLTLPHVSGLRLINEILRYDPDANIIAVSDDAKEYLIRAEDEGALRTLFKPLKEREVLEAVTYALTPDWQRRGGGVWGKDF